MTKMNVQQTASIRDNYSLNRMMLITSMEIGAIRRRFCSRGLLYAQPDVRADF